MNVLTTNALRVSRSIFVATCLVSLAAAALAAEVGTVAAAEGSAYIWRDGASIQALIGTAVHKGDQLATGRPGRMKVVFQDDSVLTVSEDSRITVDDQIFGGDNGKARSVFGLLRGKVNAAVSEYYRNPGNAYEIKTETAVAGVRGTEFTITFDPEKELTEVVGIAGTVSVRSMSDLEGSGVLVTANESTSVQRGELPTAPRRVNEKMFRERLEGFQFIGHGRAESSVNATLASGGVVKVASAGMVTQGAGAGLEGTTVRNIGCEGDATSRIGQPPSAINLTGQLGFDIGKPPMMPPMMMGH